MRCFTFRARRGNLQVTRGLVFVASPHYTCRLCSNSHGKNVGYPPEYYCSEYQYLPSDDSQDDWKIIALCAPKEIRNRFLATYYNDFDLWLSIVERCLKTYPLILSCSFANASGKAPFKQEYIIPQMLMQWVHRNKDKYNGISYFSCIDMRSEQSVWNAYNLVLPALPPYDDDGLSLALKEHFNWSMPTYVHVPILNSSTTTPDVQILDTYSNEICQALGTQYVPTELVSFARKLLNIIGNMRTVLTRSAGADMQLVLHMLDSIDANLSVLRGMDYDTFIATQREKLKGQKFSLKIRLTSSSTLESQFIKRFVAMIRTQ